MQLVDQLSAVLKQKGVSVLRFSNESGISAYKIYKWMDKKGNPKHEDVKKIEEWLKNLDNVPREKNEVSRQDDPGMTYTSPITTSDKGMIVTIPTEKDRLIAELKDRIKWLEEQYNRLLIQNDQLTKLLDKQMQKS